MAAKAWVRTTGRWMAAAAGVSAASYLGYVGYAFLTYGKGRPSPDGNNRKSLLDELMPTYEVFDLHRIRVRAPVDVTFSSACDLDLHRSAMVQGVFKTRELLLGGKSADVTESPGLVDQAKAWGWAVLGENPGREIAFGAVTQPWNANPTFRAIPVPEFVTFAEPNYVKIVWSIAADPIGPGESVARTETRAISTDATARSKFRIYWAFLSPGIILIRRVALGLVKAAAESRTG